MPPRLTKIGGGASEMGKWPNAGLNDGYNYGGDGGDGVYYGDLFGDQFGDEGWFGGGGGGATRVASALSDGTSPYPGLGGKGGGGNGGGGGSSPYDTSAYYGQDGKPNTGGGGGGTRYKDGMNWSGGRGGTGVVLIKYTIATTAWRPCTNIWLKDSSSIWHPYTMPHIKYTDNSTWKECMWWNDIMAATGGTITTSGDYKIHTFTSSGTFNVSTGGTARILVVGGGGGTPRADGERAGAGGGEVIETSYMKVSAGTYIIIVGSGGAGGIASYLDGSNGGYSSFGTDVSARGGYGVKYSTRLYGGNSGNGHLGSDPMYSSTGAGGGDSHDGYTGMYAGSNGGEGTLSQLTGNYYGGGGAGCDDANFGTGGIGGGGSNSNGGTNTGGGASGPGTGVANGKNGGSGIVVIKYKYK